MYLLPLPEHFPGSNSDPFSHMIPYAIRPLRSPAMKSLLPSNLRSQTYQDLYRLRPGNPATLRFPLGARLGRPR